MWPKLSFSQKDVVAVMAQVEAKQREVWPKQLNAKDLKVWQEALAKQFRAMARHLGQALIKKRPWALQVVADGKHEPDAGCAEDEEEEDAEGEEEEEELLEEEEDEEEEQEEDEEESDDAEMLDRVVKNHAMKKATLAAVAVEEAKEAAEKAKAQAASAKAHEAAAKEASDKAKARSRTKSAIDKPALKANEKNVCFVGYDTEHNQAWRQTPGGVKEWARELILPDTEGDQVVKAKFENGDVVPVPGITATGIKAAEEAMKFKKGHLPSHGWH